MNLFGVLVLHLLLGTVFSETCTTPNGEEARCIPVRNCSIFIEAILAQDPNSLAFIQNSKCGYSNGNSLVCCGSRASYTNTTSTETDPSAEPDHESKMELLASKRYCGYQHFDDYFHAGSKSVPAIDEYPWLAGLIHKLRNDSHDILCTGSLISNRYVLTAAHCLTSKHLELVGVRLGEYNIVEADDCVESKIEGEECTDGIAEYGIEEQIKHSGFTHVSIQHDIGLIRLNRTVTYSDYIRPICLPFSGTKVADVGKKLSVSGWGRKNYCASDTEGVKKKIFAELVPLQRCIDDYKLAGGLIINENHMCTLDDEAEGDVSCRGDSGGPVMFSNNRNQWHQEGILSFGHAGGAAFPTVNVNVAKYLDWILENIRK